MATDIGQLKPVEEHPSRKIWVGITSDLSIVAQQLTDLSNLNRRLIEIPTKLVELFIVLKSDIPMADRAVLELN